MRPFARRLPLVALAAFVATCRSNTGPSTPPGPSVAGTWHVATSALTAGTLSPDTFEFTVTLEGSSAIVALPALTWSTGSLVFNSQAQVLGLIDTTRFVVAEFPTSSTVACEFITIGGTKNATIDTLKAATVEIFDSDTGAGGACFPVTGAAAVVTK